MNIFWAGEVGDDWAEVRTELERVFELSRAAAQAGQSFVYVVHHDDLLGRRGPGNAIMATALLSAARTAAAEGTGKGWTANVVARDDDTDPEDVERWAARMIDSHGVTGELARLGPGHIGKALP